MTFLQQSLLWGLFAASIPVIIHLLNRRRFRTVKWERPKNLHNALGILKRKVGHLQEGSRRGLYQLSPAGLHYLDGRFTPA